MTFSPDIFIPTGLSFAEAASQVTHLGIVAHQDDLEIMALPGILECYEHPTKRFGGITCTSGSGSPRTGPYASYSDDEMKECRKEEQRQAARLGKYLFMAQLGFGSSEIQNSTGNPLVESLLELLSEPVFKVAAADEGQGAFGAQRRSVLKVLGWSCSTEATQPVAAAVDCENRFSQMRPQVIYTHHLLDKHPSHRAVGPAVIAALRRLPREQRPKQLLGGEVWRGLDWWTNQDKVTLDVSAHPELSEKLLRVFDSQITGGKRYDLAAIGRWRANATFASPHSVDQSSLVSYAIDLTPLIENDQLDVAEYTLGFVERFRKEVAVDLEGSDY